MKTNSAPKTVLITGCSSGIGRATARRFQRAGWNVVATMRNPEREGELHQADNTLVVALDVNDQESIDQAFRAALDRFGAIDVVVNNAGYALMGAFETAGEEQVRRQFETNVFGLMRVTRSILPHFRGRRRGLIINVASMAGRLPIPLMSVYNGSKWAVEGFSEALTYELARFDIQVKIVEPGAVNTEFFGRSRDVENATGVGDYASFSDSQFSVLDKTGLGGSSSEDVAETIFRAATDGKSTLRYQVGADAKTLLSARKLLPDRLFMSLIGWCLSPEVFGRAGRIFYKV